jgi:hypothetical protein
MCIHLFKGHPCRKVISVTTQISKNKMASRSTLNQKYSDLSSLLSITQQVNPHGSAPIWTQIEEVLQEIRYFELEHSLEESDQEAKEEPATLQEEKAEVVPDPTYTTGYNSPPYSPTGPAYSPPPAYQVTPLRLDFDSMGPFQQDNDQTPQEERQGEPELSVHELRMRRIPIIMQELAYYFDHMPQTARDLVELMEDMPPLRDLPDALQPTQEIVHVTEHLPEALHQFAQLTEGLPNALRDVARFLQELPLLEQTEVQPPPSEPTLPPSEAETLLGSARIRPREEDLEDQPPQRAVRQRTEQQVISLLSDTDSDQEQ